LQRLRSFCNSRPENNLHLGWQHGSGSQQVGAGAQQTGSGAQQVGAGAQHDGSGAQHDDCFLKQSNRPASADWGATAKPRIVTASSERTFLIDQVSGDSVFRSKHIVVLEQLDLLFPTQIQVQNSVGLFQKT
jgi:hypothetical protein